MAYKGTSSIILFQTVCNQQEKKGWPEPGMLKFVTKEICSQCSCKKKLRFLLMNVGTRRSKISSTRWAYYNSSGTMVMISASRPTKKYSQNSMWKQLRIFWTVVQILRYKCCSNKYNHRHGEGMQLLPHHTVNGQGLANCPTSLGWAELSRNWVLLFLGRVRGSVFSGFSYTVWKFKFQGMLYACIRR